MITIPATLVLLLHMQPTGRIAALAAERALSTGDLGGLRIRLVADAGAALLVLLVATTLSVYKPRGRTPYGQRKRHEEGDVTEDSMLSGRDSTSRTPRWVYMFGGIIMVLLVLFVLKHLASGSAGNHTP